MVDFDELIDQYLMKETKGKKIGIYYPSEVGKCLRKIWYSYKYPMEVKPELRKIFKMGEILHDFIAEVLSSEKTPGVELLGVEVPVKMEMKDFVVSGRVDDLMLIKESGKEILVEVKSTKDVDRVKKPGEHHEAQIQFYMYAKGIHDGMLVYVDRRDLRTKSFPIPYDEEKAKEVMERFKKLHHHLTNDTPPEPEAKKVLWMNWMCKYCEYADRCERDLNDECQVNTT